MQHRIGLKIGKRTPFVRSNVEYRQCNPVDLSVALVNASLQHLDFKRELIQHVVWGKVLPHPDIDSIARQVVLCSELAPEIEAYSVSRACATSMQAVTNAATYYNGFAHEASVTLSGGVESFSTVRMNLSESFSAAFRKLANKKLSLLKKLGGFFMAPSHYLPIAPSAKEYSTGLSMGEHAELMVKEYGITREDQDKFALQSHHNAHQARELSKDLLVSIGQATQDTLIRPSTSLEKLAALKPAFDPKHGSLTAGNSSAFTDGAASVWVVSPALENQIQCDGYLLDFEYVGIDINIGLLMGPAKAMLKLLQRNQLKFSDFDYIDMHEAFAGQVLCNLRAINEPELKQKLYRLNYDAGPLNPEQLNPWGSSLAYGHPFGATGARMISQALHFLKVNKKNELYFPPVLPEASPAPSSSNGRDFTMHQTIQLPDIITQLPKVDIPINGLDAYLLQGERQQVIFMQFAKDVEVPEHSHEAQWGSVIDGQMDLFVEGEKQVLVKGDSYFIPAGTKHSAKIYAGYKDITVFNQKDRYKTL